MPVLPGLSAGALLERLRRLRDSLWLLPTAMGLAALPLAGAVLMVDEAWPQAGGVRLGAGGADAARTVLGAVSGSMITIVGLVFSLTLVTLSLASQQFGPRLLRNFLGDRLNQAVLGTFVATFVYSLLILRAVPAGDTAGVQVPTIAVTVAIVLAIASMGLLIVYLHNVSRSIQADRLIARVAHEMTDDFDRLLPDADGDAAAAARSLPRDEPGLVRADRDGYLQAVDHETLVAWAHEHGARVRLWRRPGHFVVRGTRLASVWPQAQAGDAAEAVCGSLTLGAQRVPDQDPEFAIHQLVEVAVRALSPGINDPFTAIACVDRLAAALADLARRDLPDPVHCDGDGEPRLWQVPIRYGAFCDAALHPLRQHARRDAAVMLRLLEALASIAVNTRNDDQRRAIRRHADWLQQTAQEHLEQAPDRRAASARWRLVRWRLRAAARDGAACASAGRPPTPGPRKG